MVQPFIRNHQYNLIQRQSQLLLHAMQTASDPRVADSVRTGVWSAIMELFPDADPEQKLMLGAVSDCRGEEDIRRYLHTMEDVLEPYPQLTVKQIHDLFPKSKKLKVPDLDAVDWQRTTYLGWTDPAAGRMFLVYPLNGQLAGIEGKYTPANKGVCFLCNRHEEIALFSAIVRKKPAGASPDYYKAIGQYICLDSKACNRNLTQVAALETLIRQILGV